jgi:cation transport protein ChaC
MPNASSEIWVFGYGSLMWNPGFAFAEARHARLTGYHRAFCIYSIHYRGTLRRPGLVLGLDHGGTCEGMAFRLTPENAAATLAYLRRRELIYGVYKEATVPLALVGKEGRDPAPTVWATTFIAERAHPHYAGVLPLAREAHLILASAGRAGTNLDYLLSTRRHLRELGIREPRLERLVTLIGAAAERAHAPGATPSTNRARTRAWAAKPRRRTHTVRDNRFGYRAKLV